MNDLTLDDVFAYLETQMIDGNQPSTPLEDGEFSINDFMARYGYTRSVANKALLDLVKRGVLTVRENGLQNCKRVKVYKAKM